MAATCWPSAVFAARASALVSEPEVDRAFIPRQLERLVNDMAGLKDDMVVVMARLDRLDATTHSLVTEVRAMHGRHDRVARRVERLEEASRDAPA
jgi:hypothetical protein